MRQTMEYAGVCQPSDSENARLDELEIKAVILGGSLPTRRIDPNDIEPTKWANRHPRSFDTKEFQKLKDEIQSQGGNVQPIKVRPHRNRSDKYEIVFGHRRHRACLELGLMLVAVVEEITDSELFCEMERENRQRADLRPFEQGTMYLKALNEGLFPSARKLAECVGADLSNLGKSLNLARLPNEVLTAFDSPLDIQLRWATGLTMALQKDPDLVLHRARVIQSQSPRPSATEIFRQLTTGGGSEPPQAFEAKKVTAKVGQNCTVQIDSRNRTASISLKNFDLSRASEIEELLKKFSS